MNNRSSFDRETFQKFLANAFAVQESRIDPQSLSDIMRVQRSIESGELDLDGAMSHIVESARKVAGAAGAAIALLDGDHLTYRAGSGSGADCVGTRMTASLTVSPYTRTNREILRVEDAQTDKRIEADICRQFGANSLLMLPIYLDGAVAGLLDIRFDDAHIFQDREVYTYRLMSEQIEATLFRATQHKPENPEPEPSFVSEPLEAIPPYDEIVAGDEISPPGDDFVSVPYFFMLPENEHSLYARCGAVLSDVMKLPGLRHSALLAAALLERAKSVRWQTGWSQAPRAKLSLLSKRSALRMTALAQRVQRLEWNRGWKNWSRSTRGRLSSFSRRSNVIVTALAQRTLNVRWNTIWQTRSTSALRKLSSFSRRSSALATALAQRARNFTWSREHRRLALEAVAFVLAFTGFIAYKHHSAAALPETSTLSTSIDTNRQASLPKPVPEAIGATAEPAAVPSNEVARPTTALKRVRVGQNEVDYVADDVTVRVFTNKPTATRTRPASARVAKYGDDVTVRYFTPAPQPTRTVSR